MRCVPAPALRKCAVLTMRSSLLVSATSRTISSVTPAMLAFSDCVTRWMRTTDVRQRREVALVAHAAQQEFERRAVAAVGAHAAPGRATRAARCGTRARRLGAPRRVARDRAHARSARRRRRSTLPVLASIISGGQTMSSFWMRSQRAVRIALDAAAAGRRSSGPASCRRRTRPSADAAPRRAIASGDDVARRADDAAVVRVGHARGDAEVHHARRGPARPSGCWTASGRGARCPARARWRSRRARRASAPRPRAAGSLPRWRSRSASVGPVTYSNTMNETAAVLVGLEHRHDVGMREPADGARLVAAIARPRPRRRRD